MKYAFNSIQSHCDLSERHDFRALFESFGLWSSQPMQKMGITKLSLEKIMTFFEDFEAFL